MEEDEIDVKIKMYEAQARLIEREDEFKRIREEMAAEMEKLLAENEKLRNNQAGPSSSSQTDPDNSEKLKTAMEAIDEIVKGMNDIKETIGKQMKSMAAKIEEIVSHQKDADPALEEQKKIAERRMRRLEGTDETDRASGFKVPDGFFDSLRPMTNILLLGETGVGKSTFINSFVNYLSFESMQQAKEQGFHVLIKSGFSYTDENMRKMWVEVEPTIEVERAGCEYEENEDLTEGQTATQAPKSYVFELGPPGQQKAIRIIDTPPVGDTRGIIQDQKNFTRILNFIADFEEIHAILLLFEPNRSRPSRHSRYCINELLTHLHASAARNILFCFTRTRGTLYRPGESFNCLRDHLDQLQEKTGIEVPLNEQNIFALDNESFRYLCAWSNGVEFTDVDIFNESWSRAAEQTFKMLGTISNLTPHKVTDTLNVNNIRRLISTLARQLAGVDQEDANTIMDYCAHFAAFLKKYSIVPYNDAYLDNLEYLIKYEKEKFEQGGSGAMLLELQALRDTYEQQNRIFNQTNGTPLKTLAEINKMVDELKKLTFWGEIVEGVQNMEFLAVRKRQQHGATRIDLNRGFLNMGFLEQSSQSSQSI